MKQHFRNSLYIIICYLLFISCSVSENRKPVQVARTGYYHEQYRLQFHFTPEANWMNDPNGLVYYKGEYHLFYQYYPDSTVWGPMHWGHAVSNDLLHWKHLPVALYPDSLGYIFSGSAVADVDNTSGLGSVNNPPLVAIFTYHNPVIKKQDSDKTESEGIAYSLDNGRTWTKYKLNPVIKNPGIQDFRDPHMFRNEETKKWNLIMAVHDRVYIYSSPDIKHWAFESEFGKNAGAHGGVWECPDLFPLKVEGSDQVRWVMIVSINPGGPNKGSATQYFTGDFDGHIFHPDDTVTRWIDMGRDDYAGVTWSGIPSADGRRLFIGWMSNWDYANVVPTGVWRSAMTIPRELSLKKENGHYLIISKPVREFSNLISSDNSEKITDQNISGEKEVFTAKKSYMQTDLSFDFSLADTKTDSLGIIFENNHKEKFIVGYSVKKNKIYIDRNNSGNVTFSKAFSGISSAPYSAGSKLKLHLIVDAASVELFTDDGQLVMTTIVFPSEEFNRLKIFSRGGNVLLNSAEYHSVNRVWPSI